MQPHQINLPLNLQKSMLQVQAHAQQIAESGQPVFHQQQPIKGTKVSANNKSSKASLANPEQLTPKGQVSNKIMVGGVQNVYSNAYSKKSTAELIRQRLNITSPSKKKGGPQGFSHSDEMQYKRHTTRLVDFQIIKKLGDGAYSSVYQVRRIEDNHIYALKKVKIGAQSHKDKENAINEVRILSSLKHPNVVAYKEAFIDNESQTLNLVMQLADGGDLLKMISDRKKRKVHFRESQVWRVLIETIYGLKAMHEICVMHRDIKSANIFLFRNSEEVHSDGGNLYQAKLGDMNVSKVTAQNGLNYTQTGTPYYASPEVWKDEPYGYKSDVWSLGCVIYEMLSLKPPFSGRDMDHLYKRVCKGIFPRIPDHYSNDIWAVVQLMLQVDPEKRPDCNQLIASKMFQIYTEKLNSLESVDKTFQKTLKSASPDRAQIKKITNSLLTQLHLPANDITSLTNMLPMRNYESAHGQINKGGSLAKNNSQNVDDTQFRSSTSRKLQLIRNQHQQSRQKTQLQPSGSVPADSDSTKHEEGGDISHQDQMSLNKSIVRKNNNQKASVSPGGQKAMTKMQTKLQRQYLVNQQSNVSIEMQAVSENANNRSQNPTVITNRSSSKQHSKLQLQHKMSEGGTNSGNEQVTERDNHNSLRNRLSNKRKTVLNKEELSANASQDYRETQVEQVQQKTRKAGSVVKNNNASRAAQEQKFKSIERPGQNMTPQRNQETNQLSNQQSPSIGGNDYKSGSLKQTRLSLPVVASINANKAMLESNELTPSNQNSLAQMKNSLTEAHPLEGNLDSKQGTLLPQLSEQESDIYRTADYKQSPNASFKNPSLIQGNRGEGMPSVIKVNNSLYNGSTISKKLIISEQAEIDEVEYAQGSASPGNKIRHGKRHASYDQLVPQNNNSQIFTQNTPHAMHNQILVASQASMPVNLVNEMPSKTSRLPESQSYSQINMINNAGLPLAISKVQGSTSSSEEIPQPAFVATGTNSEVKIKHNLNVRKRVNVLASGYVHQNNQISKAGTQDYRSGLHRPSIQSQNVDIPNFSSNQQASVRHQQSDANFSLNSDELRHGGFHAGKQQIHMQSQGPIENNSQRRIMEKNKIKLPQIDNRKKSLETAASDYQKIAKLQNNIKNATISKKKPLNSGQSLQPNQNYYSSMIPQTTNNAHHSHLALSLPSSKNLTNVKTSLIQQSPMNGNQNSQSRVVLQTQAAIKKKTLAAYANSRARNNQRNNLIYTQKNNNNS